MYGIQLLLRKKPSGWVTANGKRIQFETSEAAHQEIASWKNHAWYPSYVRYEVKLIEE